SPTPESVFRIHERARAFTGPAGGRPVQGGAPSPVRRRAASGGSDEPLAARVSLQRADLAGGTHCQALGAQAQSPDGDAAGMGRDARGRKQHLYHPRWREVRDRNKFDRMAGFARVLPRIRSRVSRDMSRSGLPKEKVVATVIRLLETTFARVGNEEYAKENKSFGLTTLRDRHVDVRGATVRFVFRGKSGVEVQVGITNRRVARVIK